MGLIKEMGYPKLVRCPKCRKKVVPDLKLTATIKQIVFGVLCCRWSVHALVYN